MKSVSGWLSWLGLLAAQRDCTPGCACACTNRPSGANACPILQHDEFREDVPGTDGLGHPWQGQKAEASRWDGRVPP